MFLDSYRRGGTVVAKMAHHKDAMIPVPVLSNPFLQNLVSYEIELIENWLKRKPGRKRSQLHAHLNIHRTAVSKMLNGHPGPHNNVEYLKILANKLGETDAKGVQKCIADAEWTKLMLLWVQWQFDKKATVETKLATPEEMFKGMSGKMIKFMMECLKNYKELERLGIMETVSALRCNIDLNTQVKSLIKFADKRRALDGIHRKKISPTEKELRKLRAARKAQRGAKDVELEPMTTKLRLV
jgi:hypothetical protein